MHLPSFPAPRNRVMMLFLQETDSPIPQSICSTHLRRWLVSILFSSSCASSNWASRDCNILSVCQSNSLLHVPHPPHPPFPLTYKLQYTDQNILLVRSVIKHMPSAVLCITSNVKSVTSASIIAWEKPSRLWWSSSEKQENVSCICVLRQVGWGCGVMAPLIPQTRR